MQITDKIIAVLSEICAAEPGEIEPELDLFEAGLLDSFGVIQLITELEGEFNISLDIAAIPRERLKTVQKIAELIAETLQ